MNPTATFLANLALISRTDALIRDDGKELGIIDRFLDIFRRKTTADHFQSACKKLSEASRNGTISQLSVKDRLEILIRFRQIQKQIIPAKSQQILNAYLDEYETFALNKSKIDDLVKPLFDEIQGSMIADDSLKMARHLKKMHFVINRSSNEKGDVDRITNEWFLFSNQVKNDLLKSKPIIRTANIFKEALNRFWKMFIKPPQKIDLLKDTNDAVIKILLNRQEVVLEEVSTHLEKYPQLFRSHLETEFKKSNFPEVIRHIATLKTIMAKHSENHQFIHECVESIQQFLNHAVFHPTMKYSRGEKNKKNLLTLGEFFPILDRYLPMIKGQKLILDLKRKCANLPCPRQRSDFPHLFFSEKEQLDLLVEGLQRKEDAHVKLATIFLEKRNPSIKDITQLTKLVSSKSALSEDNRLKLRNILEKRLIPKKTIDWDDYKALKRCMEESFQLTPGQSDMSVIRRVSKAKKFFQQQLGLDEKMILIPRWYHATARTNIVGIIGSGQIQVRHEKQFSGAWISTQRETNYGPYVLSLSNKVTQLNPSVFIGFEYVDRRWRGVQKAIPIKSTQNDSPNLILVGVPTNFDKTAQKTDKLQLIKTLKEQGFVNPQALTVKQVDFLQNEVMEILGEPNLPDMWWGTGRVYSDHQMNLQNQVQAMPLEPILFQAKTAPLNQVSIAQVVQTFALPLYKQPMPSNPSYHSDVANFRVELGSRSSQSYDYHQMLVKQKQVPARAHHGTMHCVRTVLWTQVLARVYEKLGRGKVDNPILLATAGAFHDVAREDEGTDYWDNESSIVLEKLLKRTEVDHETVKKYVQTVKEKDPKTGKFTTDAQMIVHDADCLDIIRVVGKFNFSPSYLCFYKFDKKNKAFCDQLVNEAAEFIKLTEHIQVRNYLEHGSNDFYGDLVRVLFALNQKNPSKFALLTSLIQDDMQEILKRPETQASKAVLSILKI